MAEKITSDAAAPGPGRASRLGIAADPARPRAIPHARAADRAVAIVGCGVSTGRRVGQAAGRTAAVMRAGLAGWIGRSSRSTPPSSWQMAGPQQRVGRSDAGRPARHDRRENLHRQGDQNDRKKFPQPPAHKQTHPLQRGQLIMLRVRCRDWVPGKLTLSAAKSGLCGAMMKYLLPAVLSRGALPTPLPGTLLGAKSSHANGEIPIISQIA